MLESLFAAAEKDSAAREQATSFQELVSKVPDLAKPVDVYQSLAKVDRIKVIAEIKRASPSRGELSEIPNPADLAIGYEQSGADAISVLTERTGFRGSLKDLVEVSNSVSIPTLRKDFISNKYQILEARVAGASFVLLILSYLDQQTAAELMKFAQELNLGVLLETHNEKEIAVASDLGGQLIGINTRDLKTFITDLSLFERMSDSLPENAIRVAESSVKSVEDVRRYREAGADAVLVGEALVTGDWQSLLKQFVQVS